jgi:hypothetical protein
MEVFDSSLEYDLGEKAALYADAGVQESWVVNLVSRVLVVFREPEKGSYQVRFSLDLEEKTRNTEGAAGTGLRGVLIPSARPVRRRSVTESM